jgi:amicyanin
MKNQSKVTIAVVVVALIIVIGAVAAGGVKKDSASSDMNMDTTKTSDTSGTTNSDSDSKAVATMAVDIKDYMFAPMVIKVKVGDTVTWTNRDSVRHNVVADKASDDAPNGPLIGEGETYSYKFTKAGTYTFHCDPHPYMHGTVVVE